jgi:hypothetical protein
LMYPGKSVFAEKWPVAEVPVEAAVTEDLVTVTLLVDGRKRSSVNMAAAVLNGGDKDKILQHVRGAVDDKWLRGATVANVVVVPKQRMINLVTQKD